jgi:VCBS repeat-containing protein
VANPIPDQNAIEDEPFTFQFAADAFVDVDVGDSLKYTAAGLPTWLTFTAETRTFAGTPGNVDVGIIEVTVTATDNDQTPAVGIFTITIPNTNDPPLAADFDGGKTDENTSLLVDLLSHASDIDAGDRLTVVSAISQLCTQSQICPQITVNSNGILQYEPSVVMEFQELAESESLTDTVTFTVEDEAGETASASFSITVLGNNDYHNHELAFDVNKGGTVTPIDALIIINKLNRDSAGPLPGRIGEPDLDDEFYYDTNNSNSVEPQDVLVVINFLNRLQAAEGEASLSVPDTEVRASPGGAPTADASLSNARLIAMGSLEQRSALRDYSEDATNDQELVPFAEAAWTTRHHFPCSAPSAPSPQVGRSFDDSDQDLFWDLESILNEIGLDVAKHQDTR